MTDDRFTQVAIDWLCGARLDQMSWAKCQRDSIRGMVYREATDEAAADQLKAAVQTLTSAYTGLHDLPLHDLAAGLMRAAIPLVDWVAVARQFRSESH